MKRVVVFAILALFSFILLFFLAGHGSDGSGAGSGEAAGEESADKMGYVRALADGTGERFNIDLFIKDQKAYFFFPAFAAVDHFRLFYDEDCYDRVMIDSQVVDNGAEIFFDEPPKQIELVFSGERGGGRKSYELDCMWSENIPAIFIDTARMDIAQIDADKLAEDDGYIRIITSDGSTDYQGGFDMIRARGNSSFQAEKKSYRLKLTQRASLLGMEPDKSWILQANAYDNTNLRNTLASEIARDCGMPYTPQSCAADLYINGSYNGSYLLMQPVKTGTGHVDIEGDDSYLLEVFHDPGRLEEEGEGFYFMCGSEVFMKVHYPEQPSEAQKTYIDKHMNRMDSLISGLKKDDTLEEASAYLDIEGFADSYLFDFITNDIDAGNFSTFYFIDGRDHLIHPGPIWDYDKAWGNEKKKNSPVDFNAYSNRWPGLMYENSSFRDRVRERFMAVSESLESLLESGIDDMAGVIRASWEMDRIRYGNLSAQSVDEGGFEANLEQLKDYMRKRYELLSDTLFHEDHVRVFMKSRSGRFFWLKRGASLGEDRLAFIRRLYGCEGFYDLQGLPVDAARSFEEDVIIAPGSGSGME